MNHALDAANAAAFHAGTDAAIDFITDFQADS